MEPGLSSFLSEMREIGQRGEYNVREICTQYLHYPRELATGTASRASNPGTSYLNTGERPTRT